MKTLLLMVGVASLIGGETAKAPEACPAPALADRNAHSRFDPIILDLKGDGVVKTGSSTCPSVASAGGATNIKTKGSIKVSASQSGQTLRQTPEAKDASGGTGRPAADHAINTKGGGAAGRTGASDASVGCGDSIAQAAANQRCIAVNEKGEAK